MGRADAAADFRECRRNFGFRLRLVEEHRLTSTIGDSLM